MVKKGDAGVPKATKAVKVLALGPTFAAFDTLVSRGIVSFWCSCAVCVSVPLSVRPTFHMTGP